MTDQQMEFFCSLCAAFTPEQIRSYDAQGRRFHYITSRTVMNRLDDACGPAGWYPEYHVGQSGVACKLHILVPQNDDTWGWMAKSDGGGFAEMKAGDDSEKSGYTDAIKRAAAAWGIGRYLYRDGSPHYLGDQPPPSEPPRGGGGGYAPPRQAPAAVHAPQAPTSRQAPAAPPRQAPPTSGQFGWAPPTDNARAIFPWLKQLETKFGAGLVEMSNKYAKGRGYPFKTTDWDEDQRVDVCWAIIDGIKTWPNYEGEFEEVDDPRNPR